MTIRILLADDSDDFRAVVRGLLQQESDLEVVAEAADGDSAVEQARAFKPDVVSMDLEMPAMGGIEATKQIVSSLSSTNILALSLYKDVSRIQSMIDAGATGYVLKDDAYEELIPAIRAVASGENYFSAGLPPPFGTGEDPEGDFDEQ
jgi:DNA-binding NarL/FixJ family response regulator